MDSQVHCESQRESGPGRDSGPPGRVTPQLNDLEDWAILAGESITLPVSTSTQNWGYGKSFFFVTFSPQFAQPP